MSSPAYDRHASTSPSLKKAAGSDVHRRTCVHELLEATALERPDATAVEFEGACYTYWQLHSRANQFARTLRRRGVGREVLVGVCMERSLDLVVALLGILKS